MSKYVIIWHCSDCSENPQKNEVSHFHLQNKFISAVCYIIQYGDNNETKSIFKVSYKESTQQKLRTVCQNWKVGEKNLTWHYKISRERQTNYGFGFN